MDETLYKLTSPSGRPVHGGTGTWKLPKDGKPGAWRSVKGEIVPCAKGAVQLAAEHVLIALEYRRNAMNGIAHSGPHDRFLHFEPCHSLPGVEHVYDAVGDCSHCGGMQYGADDLLNSAWIELRVALGWTPYQWADIYPDDVYDHFRYVLSDTELGGVPEPAPTPTGGG